MRVASRILIALILAASSRATVWRVPSEALTIQAGIDSCAHGDTVLIFPGVYPEALRNNDFAIHLIGERSPFSDSVILIDPSLLVGSRDLACLIAAAPVTIDSIAFRNGPDMYPREDGNLSGGVVVNADGCRFSYCRFDSVFQSVISDASVSLFDCEFAHGVQMCVGTLSGAPVEARRCTFEGGGSALIQSGSGTIVQACSFVDLGANYFLNLSGAGIVIDANHFGPLLMSVFFKFHFVSFSGVISNNVFEDMTNFRPVIWIYPQCGGEIELRDNIFRDITCFGGVVHVDTTCSTDRSLVLEGNVFSNCSITQAAGKAITVPSGSLAARRNRFYELSPPSDPAVKCIGVESVLRDNVFWGNGYAVESDGELDARFNYWGDSTGPYHPVLNPNGLGDEVSDSVNFEPWYSDTSFLIDPAREPEMLPSEFALSIYPNPFNSVATISLEIPDAFVASVEVLNILGQRVAELHRGPLLGRHVFTFNADALASGVYFVRVRDLVRHSVNFSHKVLLIR